MSTYQHNPHMKMQCTANVCHCINIAFHYYYLFFICHYQRQTQTLTRLLVPNCKVLKHGSATLNSQRAIWVCFSQKQTNKQTLGATKPCGV